MYVLAPLTKLTKLSAKKKLPWGEEQQKAFNMIKHIISQEVILSYPDFNKGFNIHVGASDTQIGVVISQDSKSIAFFSCKLTDTQHTYTIGEREMLSAVETLLEFQNILLAHEVTIYTDHMNNVKSMTKYASKRIQCWRWLIEEFDPSFKYLKGEANNLADALSRLDMGKEVAEALCLLESEDVTYSTLDNVAQAEICNSVADDDIPNYVYLLSTHVIA